MKFVSTASHKLGRIIAWGGICLFLLFFVYNMCRFYGKVNVSDTEMSKNISTVESIQEADIASLEASINALDSQSLGDTSSALRVKYQRKFAGSVILGDSLTEGLTVYNWLTESIVFSKIGGSLLYSDELFESAAKTYPSNAFFAYGMNDMGNFGGDAKAFISKYEGLLADFKKTSNDTKIYICSISTQTDEAISGNKSIGVYKDVNAAIEKMCKDKGYTYIDITDILPSNPDLYAGDGIHADAVYYPIWMDRMIEKAGL